MATIEVKQKSTGALIWIDSDRFNPDNHEYVASEVKSEGSEVKKSKKK